MKLRSVVCSVLVLCLGFTFLSAATPVSAEIISADFGRGPVDVLIPDSYDPDVPAPLLLLLHGYSSFGAGQEAYMQFAPVAEANGMVYVYPDGTQDLFGLQFWNATDACCDFFGTNVDDSGYLLNIIETIEANLNIDPKRIYVTGHSNGGFMSYRMACDHSDKIAAIASLAGATWVDDSDCGATSPVNILQIHGTLDTTILYDGSCTFFQCYPGAIESARTWANTNQCALQVDNSSPNLDLDFLLLGNETIVSKVEQGCLAGGSAELWTIAAGSHVPALSSNYAESVVEYLLAHPKP